MPSVSYSRWRTTGRAELDEIAAAHAAVGGTARGRRYTTQQINRAYAVLLASQFQRFCRDLHSECVDHILTVLGPPADMVAIIRAEFTRGRQLDRGNAQPASLGADFGRLGVDFWDEVVSHSPAVTAWRDDLTELIEWRNAIAHQDFTSPRLGGVTALHLQEVRRWRRSCDRLVAAVDEVMRRYLLALTGRSPW